MSKQAEFIEGPLVVRPYCVEDIEALFTAVRASVKEVSPWLPWCHEDYSIEETRTYIQSREEGWKAEAEYSFGIFAHASGDLLGGVGINQINRLHSVGNLGYWVRSTATGRGIATKAARLVARFGLEQLGLRRIEILVAIANRASQRVAEKCGARREGILRKRLLIRGQAQDAVIYSLVAGDIV